MRLPQIGLPGVQDGFKSLIQPEIVRPHPSTFISTDAACACVETASMNNAATNRDLIIVDSGNGSKVDPKLCQSGFLGLAALINPNSPAPKSGKVAGSGTSAALPVCTAQANMDAGLFVANWLPSLKSKNHA